MDFKRASSVDEWVWIKDRAFSIEKEESIPLFMVEWNYEENFFAITCRTQNRIARDEVDNSKTDTFSILAINSIHKTLCGVNKNMPQLPKLPKEPKGFKAMLYSIQIPTDMKKVCSELEIYLARAAETTGSSILQEVCSKLFI